MDHLGKAHGVSQRPLPGSGLLASHERGVRYHAGGPFDGGYQSKRPDDSDLREEIKLVAKEHRRFGYPLAGR